jgi:hypothetical protein
MTKPTAREVWQGLVDEAGDELIAAAERMSDDEVEKELQRFGFDLEAQDAKGDAFLDALERGDEALVVIPNNSATMPSLPLKKNGKLP